MPLTGFRFRSLLVITLLPLITTAQIKVTNLADSAASQRAGVYYSLPMTRLKVEITLSRTTSERGPFYEYAKDYLGIEDVIRSSSVAYDIQSVTIIPVQEPDPTQLYLIERKPVFPFLQKKQVNVRYTPDGFLQQISLYKSKRPFTSTKEFTQKDDTEKNTRNKGKSSTRPYFVNQDVLGPDQIIEMEKDSVAPPPPPRIISKAGIPATKLADKAKETLANLAVIRDNRQKLVSGYQEVGYEPGTLKLMLEELLRLEQATIELFTGYSTRTETKVTFTYLPVKSGPNSIILGYLDPLSGLSADPGGNKQALTLQLSAETDLQAAPGFSMISKKHQQGIVYRIPAAVECSLIKGINPVFSSQVLINQLGVSTRLSTAAKHILFNPETGGLKEVR